MSAVVLRIHKTGGATLTVNGGGNTIDAANQFRPFFALDGATSISNLTVNNGRAAGGSGGSGGGGGGLGAGGVLFVNNSATVSISNVSFTNSTAIGGKDAATTTSGGEPRPDF